MGERMDIAKGLEAGVDMLEGRHDNRAQHCRQEKDGGSNIECDNIA